MASAWNLPRWDRTDSPWRPTDECAAYLGKFDRATGALNLRETREFLKREGVRSHPVGRSLRFWREDVERILPPKPVAKPRHLRRVG